MAAIGQAVLRNGQELWINKSNAAWLLYPFPLYSLKSCSRKKLPGILIFPYAALYYFNAETALMERDENFLEKMDPVPGVVRGRPCSAGGSVAGRIHLLRFWDRLFARCGIGTE